jgi:hypothetical protein
LIMRVSVSRYDRRHIGHPIFPFVPNQIVLSYLFYIILTIQLKAFTDQSSTDHRRAIARSLAHPTLHTLPRECMDLVS